MPIPRTSTRCCTRAFRAGDGVRVPGALSGFELAVRAVLGQQITVAAARTLAQRLVERFGETVGHALPRTHAAVPRTGGAGAGRRRCARPARHRQAAAGRDRGHRAGGGRQATAAARRRRRAGHPRSNCSSCRASATGRRNTLPCARCAGPTHFRPATWHCRKRWACRQAPARPARRWRHRRPGSPGAATPWCGPGTRCPCRDGAGGVRAAAASQRPRRTNRSPPQESS